MSNRVAPVWLQMALIKNVLPEPWGPANKTDRVSGVLFRISSEPWCMNEGKKKKNFSSFLTNLEIIICAHYSIGSNPFHSTTTSYYVASIKEMKCCRYPETGCSIQLWRSGCRPFRGKCHASIAGSLDRRPKRNRGNRRCWLSGRSGWYPLGQALRPATPVSDREWDLSLCDRVWLFSSLCGPFFFYLCFSFHGHGRTPTANVPIRCELVRRLRSSSLRPVLLSLEHVTILNPSRFHYQMILPDPSICLYPFAEIERNEWIIIGTLTTFQFNQTVIFLIFMNDGV